MSATQPPKDLPPIPPRKKTPGGRGRWKDVLIVHDDIRFGINTFRSVEPGDPDADNETPEATRTPRRRRPRR
ncbi:hypothetical protein [Gordonia sp. CNJ-863]|uniref:hypothetical protein n=1 Tax=Gordonia sp. CNJ-863 TaxID=1904963 RepID=UPI0011153932|nr:hypothetical protein [Gordonia sp. CNJ-863]